MRKPRTILISNAFDLVLLSLKWPVAAVSLYLLPGALLATFELLTRIVMQPLPMTAFLVGLAAYTFVWLKLFRRSRFTLFLTLEHELTHALFAFLTFHRVTDVRVTAFCGGQVRFVGRGNWLIALAPYFFPTVSVFLILLLIVLPLPINMIGNMLVGASFAYHLTSALRETHPGQTDIRESGAAFALLILPTANLISAGVVLAYSHQGLKGLHLFLTSIWKSSNWLLSNLS